ncbi:MAG: hypothetical protein IPO21_14770 [Bacteroidales bacterium]|nr:hypothetical protein [Bacteroidales bacterium]
MRCFASDSNSALYGCIGCGINRNPLILDGYDRQMRRNKLKQIQKTI